MKEHGKSRLFSRGTNMEQIKLMHGELLSRAMEKNVQNHRDEAVDVGCVEKTCWFTLSNQLISTWTKEEKDAYRFYQLWSNIRRIEEGMKGLRYE